MGPLGPGRGLSFFLGVLLLAAYAVAPLLYLVHTRSQSIFLGYRIARARAEQRELFEQNRELQIQARVMRAPERLQRAAARQLGLRPPHASQVRRLPPVQPEGRPGSDPDPKSRLARGPGMPRGLAIVEPLSASEIAGRGGAR